MRSAFVATLVIIFAADPLLARVANEDTKPLQPAQIQQSATPPAAASSCTNTLRRLKQIALIAATTAGVWAYAEINKRGGLDYITDTRKYYLTRDPRQQLDAAQAAEASSNPYQAGWGQERALKAAIKASNSGDPIAKVEGDQYLLDYDGYIYSKYFLDRAKRNPAFEASSKKVEIISASSAAARTALAILIQTPKPWTHDQKLEIIKQLSIILREPQRKFNPNAISDFLNSVDWRDPAEELNDILDDTEIDPAFHQLAAESAAILHERSTIPILMQMIEQPYDNESLPSAVKALGDFHATESIDSLERIFQSGNKEDYPQMDIARALIKIKGLEPDKDSDSFP